MQPLQLLAQDKLNDQRVEYSKKNCVSYGTLVREKQWIGVPHALPGDHRERSQEHARYSGDVFESKKPVTRPAKELCANLALRDEIDRTRRVVWVFKLRWRRLLFPNLSKLMATQFEFSGAVVVLLCHLCIEQRRVL